jgi:uncharacterized membrane protein
VDLERLPQSGSGCPVRSLQEGYIQAIDTETLLKLAVDEDLFIRLRCKPGDFIEKNQVLLDTWPHHTIEFHNQPVADANSANREPNRCQGTTSSAGAHELEALRKRVDATFFTGRRRTPRQDAECALEELVEVAVRALSPGINDPFTAIACIDRLAAALGVVAERSLPNPLRYDDDLNPRILTRETAFSNLMDAAFHQIRQYGCDSVAVAIRLLEAFRRIATHITTQQQHASIVRHAKMLNRDFRQHVSEPDDGDDFRTAMDNLMSTLAQSGEEISGKDSPQAIGL